MCRQIQDLDSAQGRHPSLEDEIFLIPTSRGDAGNAVRQAVILNSICQEPGEKLRDDRRRNVVHARRSKVVADFDLRCAKCKARMEQGFIPDRGQAYIDRRNPYMYLATWVAGTPERSFWLGITTRGRAEIPVRTFRCTACGYLESYARLDESKAAR
jgi:hypothetical protein